MITDKMVEAGARAIKQSAAKGADLWDGLTEAEKDLYRAHSRAALEAVERLREEECKKEEAARYSMF